jgi:hypothetical protein
MTQGGIEPPSSRCKREGLPLAYWVAKINKSSHFKRFGFSSKPSLTNTIFRFNNFKSFIASSRIQTKSTHLNNKLPKTKYGIDP